MLYIQTGQRQNIVIPKWYDNSHKFWSKNQSPVSLSIYLSNGIFFRIIISNIGRVVKWLFYFFTITFSDLVCFLIFPNFWIVCFFAPYSFLFSICTLYCFNDYNVCIMKLSLNFDFSKSKHYNKFSLFYRFAKGKRNNMLREGRGGNTTSGGRRGSRGLWWLWWSVAAVGLNSFDLLRWQYADSTGNRCTDCPHIGTIPPEGASVG